MLIKSGAEVLLMIAESDHIDDELGLALLSVVMKTMGTNAYMVYLIMNCMMAFVRIISCQLLFA